MKISYAKAKRQVEDVDEEGALRCAFSPFLVLRVNHTEAAQLLFLALEHCNWGTRVTLCLRVIF